MRSNQPIIMQFALDFFLHMLCLCSLSADAVLVLLTSISTKILICESEYEYIQTCLFTCICISLCICIYNCVIICICICIYICMCICISICICGRCVPSKQLMRFALDFGSRQVIAIENNVSDIKDTLSHCH